MIYCFHDLLIQFLIISSIPACRYDKGTFGECQPSGEMTRIDKLKSTSDSATCQATRTITKKCNKSKQEKQAKDRNSKEKKQKGKKVDERQPTMFLKN